MKFIVKDEPTGWAISVWVMDDRPTGWLLMVPDEVVRGEIIWRWDPVTESSELPEPTFRFNWDFVEEFTCAMQKKLPKRVDDELIKTLDIERARVDQFIGFLTHKGMLDKAQIHTPQQTAEMLFNSDYDVTYLKQQNEVLQKQVQMLQAELLKAKGVPKGAAMHHADAIMKEVYGPQETYQKINKGAASNPLAGNIYSAEVHNGIDGPITTWVKPDEFLKQNLEGMGFVLPEQ